MGIPQVLQMRLTHFFLWLDVMPEVRRRRELRQFNLQLLVGQRGLSDEDFDQVAEDLGRVRCNRPKPPAETQGHGGAEGEKLRAVVEKMNAVVRGRAGAGATA